MYVPWEQGVCSVQHGHGWLTGLSPSAASDPPWRPPGCIPEHVQMYGFLPFPLGENEGILPAPIEESPLANSMESKQPPTQTMTCCFHMQETEKKSWDQDCSEPSRGLHCPLLLTQGWSRHITEGLHSPEEQRIMVRIMAAISTEIVGYKQCPEIANVQTL